MRLKKWTDEQRLLFNQKRVRGMKIAEALRVTLVEFPDAELYEYQTVLAYTNSTQGCNDLRTARETVIAVAKENLLAEGGGRLDVLTDVLTNLMGRFSNTPDDRAAVSLAGEIRGLIKEIRMEVDPLGLEGATGQSHFEKMISSFEQLKEADKDRILAVSEASWGDPRNLDAN